MIGQSGASPIGQCTDPLNYPGREALLPRGGQCIGPRAERERLLGRVALPEGGGSLY